MKYIKFEVGKDEKHEITFCHDYFGFGSVLSDVLILIDGKARLEERPIQIPEGLYIFFPGRYLINFQVGYAEIHLIRIEIDIYFGKYHLKVFVDDELVAQKQYPVFITAVKLRNLLIVCGVPYFISHIYFDLVNVLSFKSNLYYIVSLLTKIFFFTIFVLFIYSLFSKEREQDLLKK